MIKRNIFFAVGVFFSSVFLFSCDKEYGYDFENGYNPLEYEDTINVDLDTDKFKVDYSKYTQARMFPGLMDAEEPRLEKFVVPIDLNYEEIRSTDLRISVAPGNWQSTGVYAPAGELITIEVPAGVYGLTAQVGAHVATSTSDIDFPQRDPVIYTRQVLFPGENLVRNLYGGLVYILPERPLGRVVDLEFSGVAKAPSFKLGEMTNEEWFDLVEKSTVPWFEMESRWICFTMETAKLKDGNGNVTIPDPTELMETWDRSIREGYWEWTGMTEGNPDIRHRAPFNKWRIVHDVLFKNGVAQVSGYPVRARNNSNYFNQAIEIEGVKFQNWGTYHEIGHNMQMGSTWSFGGNGEVTNNLFSFKISRLNGKKHSNTARVWNNAVEYIGLPKSKEKVGDNELVNWSTLETKYGEAKAYDIRLAMWVQIMEKYGYDFITYIYKKGREARFTSANDQSKVDFFYEALSEFTETDMEPYLNQWGLYPSSISKKYIAENKEYPVLTYDVWNFNPVDDTGGDNIIIPELDKSNWEVISVSSAQNPYPGANLLDGDESSIWHSCYNNCTVGSVPPAGNDVTWDIVIDLKNVENISGFTLVQRDTDHLKNSPTAITLSVSDDNSSFTEIGEYSLSHTAEKQFIDLHSDKQKESFRYAKFTIKRSDLYGLSDGETNTALAELGFYSL